MTRVAQNRSAAAPDSRNLDDNGELLYGQGLIDRVRELAGDTILLSFSCGKDSLALWLHLRPHFNIIPYYMWIVPGLRFVEAALEYYEDYFETEIVRMAHPLFYDMFTTGVYQPVHRLRIIDGLQLPRFDLADVDNVLAAYYGLDAPFTAIGFRSADNIQRYRLLRQMGPLGFKRRRWFYGIWDWTVDDVAECILSHGVKIAPDYRYWGRTIGSISYPEINGIRAAFPDDFERIRFWFPLIDAEFYRYEQVGKGRKDED
ncbi:MAG: phosphoadenosine phosphosulfate reductase [Anaerolineae bacterium]|nr:phosphoadenosine phosphosulfate reductase [Anaerolineae bacterium]